MGAKESKTKRCLELETKLKQVVLDVAAPHWKDEWKLMVVKLANRIQLYQEVEVIDIGNHNFLQTFHLQFARAPTLRIRICAHLMEEKSEPIVVNGLKFIKDVHSWMLINYQGCGSSGGSGCYPSNYVAQETMQTLLKMESLPFNLFISIFYSLGEMFGLDDPFCVEPRSVRKYGFTRPESLGNKIVVAEENLVYLLPQHYNPAILNGNCGQDFLVGQYFMPGLWSSTFCKNYWSLNGKLNLPDFYAARFDDKRQVSTVFRRLVTPGQIDKLIKLLFRYSPAKQVFAQHLVKRLRISAYEADRPNSIDLYLPRSNGKRCELSTTWLPASLNDDTPLPHRFLKSSDAEHTDICAKLSSTDLEHRLTITYNTIDPSYNYEYNLLIHAYFTPSELGMLIAWVTSCHNGNGRHLEDYFANLSADDSFSDLDNLGGRFADTEILRTITSFKAILPTLLTLPLVNFLRHQTDDCSDAENGVSGMTSQISRPLPTALSQLISSYLPFPPPQKFP